MKIKRYKGNPIITPNDLPYEANAVYNPGVCKFKDEIILILRVEGYDGRSFFGLARSKDGYNFKIEKEPVMVPSEEKPFNIYEDMGIEDPRITEIDGIYYILYMANSHYGTRIGLARTEDFKNFERIALISEVDNRDAALFPRKIKGKYARLDRPIPNPFQLPSIWISYSEDLIHWGESEIVAEPRAGGTYWDGAKIGICTPPLETPQGWLVLYHGVKNTPTGTIYRIGSLLLDLENPSKVIGRSHNAILSPEEDYERKGNVNNVVFSCGWVVDGEEVKIYYGAADTCIGVATAKIEDLIRMCDNL